MGWAKLRLGIKLAAFCGEARSSALLYGIAREFGGGIKDSSNGWHMQTREVRKLLRHISDVSS
jgi:hypothetical protein